MRMPSFPLVKKSHFEKKGNLPKIWRSYFCADFSTCELLPLFDLTQKSYWTISFSAALLLRIAGTWWACLWISFSLRLSKSLCLLRIRSKCLFSWRLTSFSAGAFGLYGIMQYSKDLRLRWIESKVSSYMNLPWCYNGQKRDTSPWLTHGWNLVCNLSYFLPFIFRPLNLLYYLVTFFF